MKVVFGCDPNATQFKLDLMEYVKSLGHEVADLGSDDPIYANTAIEVAKAVAAKEYDRGIHHGYMQHKLLLLYWLQQKHQYLFHKR